MRFTLWGVRGSIPVPGPHTLRYGGNTTCIEVRTDDNDLIIFDAGTGIFQLSQTLFKEMPLKAHLFITHTHWDHIQGLPFFIPIFIPGNSIRIHGAADPVTQRGISDVLARQMEYAYFPVREAELNARIEYVNLHERQEVQVGCAKITNLLLNHPVLNYGYRVECNGKSLVFTGDHEWPYNIYTPEDDYFEEFEEMVAEKRAGIMEFFRGVDALIIDTAYTIEEYPSKLGWGHGTFDASIAAAREAGVKRVYLTHHEPNRSDDRLEQVFQEAVARAALGPGDPEVVLAREGLTIEL